MLATHVKYVDPMRMLQLSNIRKYHTISKMLKVKLIKKNGIASIGMALGVIFIVGVRTVPNGSDL